MRPSTSSLFGRSWYRPLDRGHDVEDQNAGNGPSSGPFHELKDVSLEDFSRRSNSGNHLRPASGERNLPDTLSSSEEMIVISEGEDTEGEPSEPDEKTPLTKLPNQINLHISGNVVVKPTACDLDWKIGEAKQQIFPKEFETKRIRIICRGKLLSDDSARLGDFVDNGGHLHISITEKRRPGEDDEEQEGPDASLDIQENLLEDLRIAGMLQLVNQENVWVEEPQQRQGSNTEFVFFAMMGMLLGFIMLIFLFQTGVTRKKKYGILAGITLHVIINLTGSDYFSIP